MDTDQFAACSESPLHAAWPPDFDGSQDVDGSDLFLFAERFGTDVGVAPPVGMLSNGGRSYIYPADVSLHKIDGSDRFVLATHFDDGGP